MINPWFQFLLSAAVIIWAGNRLTCSAKTIVENTKIGTIWAGAIMLPLVTSLPELVTCTRAVLIDAPDLALGNIFGSNLFNLALLAVIDLAHGRGALTARVNNGHVLTASLGASTACLVALAVVSPVFVPVFWVGSDTILVALIYLMGSRLLFSYEIKNSTLREACTTGDIAPASSTRRALLNYILAAVLIIASGVFVTDAADLIALQSGLGHTFVGTLLLAASTSLPEAVTTVTAVRLGLPDMAVANIFGANFLNLFILFWADLFYRPAPLLTVVSGTHVFAAIMVVMLTMVIIIGLIYRSKRELMGVGYDALIVFVGYLVAIYYIFKVGGN